MEPEQDETLFETLKKTLEDQEWRFDSHEDRGIIYSDVRASNATYRVVLAANHELEIASIFVEAPTMIPEKNRHEICEFVNRANYGLRLGNFEMDMSDGELRFRVSVDVESSRLTTTMVRNMLAGSIETMDRYFPGTMSVVHAGKSAEEAIDDIEGNGTTSGNFSTPGTDLPN